MLSIGGITYVDAWNQALAQNATQLGLNAAEVAGRSASASRSTTRRTAARTSPGYRPSSTPIARCTPYDATGNDPAARLTIDLAAGDRWLIALHRRGHRRLAHARRAGARLRERDGAGPAAERVPRADELAGARGRQAEVRAADPAARAARVHREPLYRGGLEGAAGVHQLQRLAAELDRRIRASRRAERRGDDAGHARLHVLGGGAALARGCTTPPNTCEGGVGAGATPTRSRSRCPRCASSNHGGSVMGSHHMDSMAPGLRIV